MYIHMLSIHICIYSYSISLLVVLQGSPESRNALLAALAKAPDPDPEALERAGTSKPLKSPQMSPEPGLCMEF